MSTAVTVRLVPLSESYGSARSFTLCRLSSSATPFASHGIASAISSFHIGRGSVSKNRQDKPDGRNAAFDCRVMSRKHAEIGLGEKEGVYIKDQASTHGTRLNNKPLRPQSPVALRHADVLTFGEQVKRGNQTFDAVKVRVEITDMPKSSILETPSSHVDRANKSVFSDSASDQQPEVSEAESMSQDSVVSGGSKRKAEVLIDDDAYDERPFSLIESQSPVIRAAQCENPSVELGSDKSLLRASNIQSLETRPRKALRRMPTTSCASPFVADSPVSWRRSLKAYLTGALFGVLVGGAGMIGALNSLPETTFQ